MGAVGAILGKVGISLVMSLLTETFIKKALLATLEYLVKKTASDVDDKVLAAAREAWRVD
jgi:hypothetical protein